MKSTSSSPPLTCPPPTVQKVYVRRSLQHTGLPIHGAFSSEIWIHFLPWPQKMAPMPTDDQIERRDGTGGDQDLFEQGFGLASDPLIKSPTIKT